MGSKSNGLESVVDFIVKLLFSMVLCFAMAGLSMWIGNNAIEDEFNRAGFGYWFWFRVCLVASFLHTHASFGDNKD